MRIKLRDLVILPLLAVVTPALLFKSTDLALQQKYTTSASHLGRCLDYAHATAGIPGIPNCTTHDKTFETPLVEYEFNQCGYRSGGQCKPFSTDVYGIAILGSSVPFGQFVPYDQTIVYVLPDYLSSQQQGKYAIENFSRMEEYPQASSKLVSEAIALKPKLVLWILSPFDVSTSTLSSDYAYKFFKLTEHNNHLGFWGEQAKSISSVALILSTLHDHLKNRILETRAATFLLELYYHGQGKQRYIRQYLRGQDSEIGYLPTHPSEAWKESYQAFNQSIAQMSVLTRTAGIPFVVVLLPTRAQEVMLNSGSWPPGYDPYLIDQKVKSIVTSHGGIYLDIFPECARITGLEKHYFIQNAHPDGFAHTVFARLIAQQLTSGIIPALRTQQPVGKEQ